MARQQNMLASLRHGTIGGRNHQNCAVHLGRASDHVFYVVGMSRAIDVSVVPFVGFILDMGDVNGNATFSFFGRLIDLIVG